VCGCDGVVHEDECAAQLEGVDVGASSCASDDTPQGMFPCGYLFCDPTAEYCEHAYGDTCDDSFYCRALDPLCPTTYDAACADCQIPACEECVCIETPGNGVTGITIGTVKRY